MELIFVIVGTGVAAALVSFVVAASDNTALDPIDPSGAEIAVKRSIRHHPKVRGFLAQRTDRTKAGGWMLTAGFVIVFLAALLIGVVLQLINHSSWAKRIDKSVAAWGSDHASSESVDVIKFITNFGASKWAIAALTVVAIIDYVRRRNPEVFAFAAAVAVGELVLHNVLKLVVHRARPDVLHLVTANGYSFPSGHTVNAAAIWSAIALILGRNQRRAVRAALAGGAALIALSVATSRALLGVHWVTDVVAGLGIGWGWFLLVAVIFGGRRQRMGDPSADDVANTPSAKSAKQPSAAR